MTRLCAWLLFAGACLSSQLLAAQDKAVAAQLFEAAGELMAAGKLADACPKYAESQRLDPQLGTLLHLAECLYAQGKTASAWANFKDAVDLAAARGDLREQKIRARLAEIEPKVPRLTFRVSPTAPAELEIKRNGSVVGKPAWGLPLPVDPGEHAIAASAPGRMSWSQSFALPAGARVTVDVPELPAADSGAVPAPVAPPAPVAELPAPSPPETVQPVEAAPVSVVAQPAVAPTDTSEPAGRGRAQRIAGWGVRGLGVVGLGVGVVFEIKSVVKLGDRADVCPMRVECDDGSQDKIDGLTKQAQSARRVGTIALIVGGILAAGGLALILTSPSGERASQVSVAPVIAPGHLGFSVAGRL